MVAYSVYVSLMFSESYDLNYSCESYDLWVLWSELLTVVIHHTWRSARGDATSQWKAFVGALRYTCGGNAVTCAWNADKHVMSESSAPLPSTGSLWICGRIMVAYSVYVSLMFSESYDLNYSCESYDLWILWSELFMWVLWPLSLMIWIACSVPALSEICMKDGNKPFDVWKKALMWSDLAMAAH